MVLRSFCLPLLMAHCTDLVLDVEGAHCTGKNVAFTLNTTRLDPAGHLFPGTSSATDIHVRGLIISTGLSWRF